MSQPLHASTSVSLGRASPEMTIDRVGAPSGPPRASKRKPSGWGQEPCSTGIAVTRTLSSS